MQDDGFMIRMGGDEFALLFTSEDPESMINSSLAATQKAMESQKQVNKLPIGISVGLVSIPPGITASQDDIYRLADVALYRAKDRKDLYTGRANIICRTAELDKKRQVSVA
jgi:diguanylate cyclase (GGDEF)-like protein